MKTMALLPYARRLFATKCYGQRNLLLVRNLMSKELTYSQFGDPLSVVKFRENQVPELGSQEVLVRMLAAPVNPADINTIQGSHPTLPKLPTIPGDEGVGYVVEIGKHVCTVIPGQRVVFTSRLRGTWRYYGVHHERDVHVIAPNIPLAEASMLTIAPCMAYRMLLDFKKLHPGQTVIQNAANSPCGQCVIQLCKAWGFKTLNIVANHCGFEAVKEHLLRLGADAVYTLEQAEELTSFNTSLVRPTLALNCLGGRYEDVMLKLLERKGDLIYYGCAYDLPLAKQFLRCDATFHKFHLADWDCRATTIQRDLMLKEIIQLMVTGQFKAPTYEPVILKNYKYALRNTVHCEAFSTISYIFDFSLP